VQRDREHAGVGVERVLGAVAVVDVPVDDRHPLDPQRRAGVQRGERGVREQAVAAGERGLGVVAGRAHERVGVVDVAADDRLDRGERAARGAQRDLVRARADRRGLAGLAAARGADRGQALQVLGRVEPEDLLGRRVAAGDRRQRVDQAAARDEVAEARLARRALRVRHARLDEPARGQERRPGARVVPRVRLVPVPSGRHSGPSPLDVGRLPGPVSLRPAGTIPQRAGGGP
jgi:hypothetical protein